MAARNVLLLMSLAHAACQHASVRSKTANLDAGSGGSPVGIMEAAGVRGGGGGAGGSAGASGSSEAAEDGRECTGVLHLGIGFGGDSPRRRVMQCYSADADAGASACLPATDSNVLRLVAHEISSCGLVTEFVIVASEAQDLPGAIDAGESGADDGLCCYETCAHFACI